MGKLACEGLKYNFQIFVNIECIPHLKIDILLSKKDTNQKETLGKKKIVGDIVKFANNCDSFASATTISGI